MRRLIIASGLALSLVTGTAWAAPIKREAKLNMVKVTGTNVAKDRSGTAEYVKLVIESSHRTEERVVVGTIRLKKAGEDDVICEFSEVVPAAGKKTQDLRDCARHEPDDIEIELSTVAAPSPEPAPAPPEPTPEPEQVPDPLPE